MQNTAAVLQKVGPDTLGKVLGRLPKFHEDNLLVGFETSDDAAVYKLSDDTAVIQTLDFFTPVVDDSLYVRTDCGCECAKRRICDGRRTEDRVEYRLFSRGNWIQDYLGEILQGGAEKVLESGAVLVGGHSIQDDVPKIRTVGYGTCSIRIASIKTSDVKKEMF